MGAGIRASLTAMLLCTASAAAAAAAADGDAPICADRPGKSSQACTVPAGHFQFESSFADWTVDKNNDERATALAVGETGFKYGLSDRSHIDIDVAPWVRTTSQPARCATIHPASATCRLATSTARRLRIPPCSWRLRPSRSGHPPCAPSAT